MANESPISEKKFETWLRPWRVGQKSGKFNVDSSIFNGRNGQRVELHHYDKFRQNLSNRVRDMLIFRFFKMAVAANLDFQNFRILKVGTVKRVELYYHAKFRPNCCYRGQDMVFLVIFKMGAAAILNFWNFKFLTVGRIASVELRHRGKFRRNRSNCGRDMWVSILCEFGLKMPIHAPFWFLNGVWRLYAGTAESVVHAVVVSLHIMQLVTDGT